MTGDILHEDGDFRLYHLDGITSVLAHRCNRYPYHSKTKWWFLPSPHKCYVCDEVPSNEIFGLYTLHNWDRLWAVK